MSENANNASTKTLTNKHWLGIILTVVVFFLIMVLGYALSWDWVGVGDYISPQIDPNIEFERQKTLWDWLDLFFVPLLLAVGGVLLNWAISNAQERIAKKDKWIEKDRQQQITLEKYFDTLSDLLLDYGFDQSDKGEKVKSIAQIRTNALFISKEQLDKKRKGLAIRFLCDAKLITGENPIIDLKRSYLSGLILSDANLEKVNLNEAILYGSRMNRANLQNASLEGAKLDRVLLKKADLRGANLENAILKSAELISADLRGANLRGAELDFVKMNAAKFNQDTIPPNDEFDFTKMGADFKE